MNEKEYSSFQLRQLVVVVISLRGCSYSKNNNSENDSLLMSFVSLSRWRCDRPNRASKVRARALPLQTHTCSSLRPTILTGNFEIAFELGDSLSVAENGDPVLHLQ